MSEGPGILEIALAVALGIGIAYDDGWIGNKDAKAVEPVTPVTDTAIPASVPAPAVTLQPK